MPRRSVPRRANLYPRADDAINRCLDALLFQFYAKNDGLRLTDLHQGIVWGTNTDQTVRDERLVNRFDYDSDYGTVLNRCVFSFFVGFVALFCSRYVFCFCFCCDRFWSGGWTCVGPALPVFPCFCLLVLVCAFLVLACLPGICLFFYRSRCLWRQVESPLVRPQSAPMPRAHNNQVLSNIVGFAASVSEASFFAPSGPQRCDSPGYVCKHLQN